jgi:predicted AAA+ superfamily ATPase
LTFYEYLQLLKSDNLEAQGTGSVKWFFPSDINALNDSFVHYLNYGRYPEVLFSDAIQKDLGRFIKSDIIDKVLLRDLPSLYGIQDIQELNAVDIVCLSPEKQKPAWVSEVKWSDRYMEAPHELEAS